MVLWQQKHHSLVNLHWGLKNPLATYILSPIFKLISWKCKYIHWHRKYLYEIKVSLSFKKKHPFWKVMFIIWVCLSVTVASKPPDLLNPDNDNDDSENHAFTNIALYKFAKGFHMIYLIWNLQRHSMGNLLEKYQK